jgi:hypothetical protein
MVTSSIPGELILRASVWLWPGITPCVKTQNSYARPQESSTRIRKPANFSKDITAVGKIGSSPKRDQCVHKIDRYGEGREPDRYGSPDANQKINLKLSSYV